MDSAECLEWERIALMVGRDGVPAARAFAEQGIGQYESAIREADSGGNQYGAAYRESLLASVRVYRQYLEQKESAQIGPDM
jgi:hypothetical protein